MLNTATRYGVVARGFHWIIAVLVLVDLALGVIGDQIPRNADTVDWLKTLYSTHKTIGVTVLALAVLRVIWALTQTRPVPLHPDRRAETLAAETAHWLLYGAIFILPLSGWVMHSAEVGFAPIWWPFGQNLPFVPKSEAVAETAATVHWAASVVLGLTVFAHIGGAMKHTLLDRDGTLARMLFGKPAGKADAGHHAKALTFATTIAIWAVVIGGALAVLAPETQAEAGVQTPLDTASGWVVQDGTLAITVTQSGAAVTGGFANWQAAIEYDPETGMGQATAMIDTTSLTLGSVTTQAKGAEFFNTAEFTESRFEGVITRTEAAAHVATGTLLLVGQEVPVTLIFDLEITDGIATMQGSATLDRRDFGMGAGYGDESTVGFGVDVAISLTAQRTQ